MICNRVWQSEALQQVAIAMPITSYSMPLPTSLFQNSTLTWDYGRPVAIGWCHGGPSPSDRQSVSNLIRGPVSHG